MVHKAPQFEQADLLGSTSQLTGTVGTSNTNVPTLAGNKIAEIFVRCPQQLITNRLSFSINGGTNFFVLAPGEWMSFDMRGNTLTQLILKGNIASVSYEVLLELEPA